MVDSNDLKPGNNNLERAEEEHRQNEWVFCVDDVDIDI